MLVKFTNNTEEFEKKVEDLKSVLGVGAASKVAEYCVSNYSYLDARAHKLENRVEALLDVIDGLRDAVRQRESAEQQIQILLGEKL